MELGPRYFRGFVWEKTARALVMTWAADTPFRNLRWVRYVVFRLGWPPVKWISGVLDIES